MSGNKHIRIKCSAAALLLLLCSCSRGRLLTLTQSEGGGVAVTDEKNGITYEKIESRSIIPGDAGEKYAGYKAADGTSRALYSIDGADPLRYLRSEENGREILFSSVPVPSLLSADASPVSFYIYYSDDEAKPFGGAINDSELIGKLTALLRDGETAALPAHDCVTYLLEFDFGEGYEGMRYALGCVYDSEDGVSYIYDRDEKRTVCAAELLNGLLPYSGSGGTAATEAN